MVEPTVVNQVKAIMADVLSLDLSAIDDSASMETIETWNSLAHINLISALEEELDIEFAVDEFEQMTTFIDLLDCIASKL
jgi:acyl carrier protein